MELITLNSSYQPNELVENYESLIWTERYASNGDFELTSGEVSQITTALPRESVVSLRNSNVPMIVEDHKITKSINGAPMVTITGRTFETVLERRTSIRSIPVGLAEYAIWSENMSKESDLAYYVLRTLLGDSSSRTPGVGMGPTLPPVTAAIPEDAMPELNLILPADWNATAPTFLFEVAAGNLYGVIMDLLSQNNHGLKAIRPLPGQPAKIGIEIYVGTNRTDTARFDAHFDQFDDTTYLLSNRGSANTAYVITKKGSQVVNRTVTPATGLNRRVVFVDEQQNDKLPDAQIRTFRGLVELSKYNATALFEGQLSDQVASGYNTTYFLGDILKLVGEYGLDRNVRVAEFIRSSDASGEKAYPAFEAVD